MRTKITKGGNTMKINIATVFIYLLNFFSGYGLAYYHASASLKTRAASDEFVFEFTGQGLQTPSSLLHVSASAERNAHDALIASAENISFSEECKIENKVYDSFASLIADTLSNCADQPNSKNQ